MALLCENYRSNQIKPHDFPQQVFHLLMDITGHKYAWATMSVRQEAPVIYKPVG